MTSNTLSIITVSFQAASTIKSALDSVSRQNIVGLEHLVQDGGSTDETATIVGSYAHARFISEPDGGIYDGLNNAIKNTTGDIIGLLHADDFYPYDNVLAQVMEVFDQNPDVLGVYGDLNYVSSSNPKRVVRAWRSQSYHKGLLRRGWMPPHPTLFLRREVYETVGDFDTRFMISADYDFVIRVFSHCGDKIIYLPNILINMRLGGISNSGLRNLIRKFREDLIIARGAGFFAPFTVICKMASKLVQIRLPL
jgi:glycosyltransferase